MTSSSRTSLIRIREAWARERDITSQESIVSELAAQLGYKLVKVGAIGSNGTSSIDIEGLRMYDLEEGVAKFAFRIINIPTDKMDVVITMTPYYVVEIDGVETTIYGEAQTGSYAEIAG